MHPETEIARTANDELQEEDYLIVLTFTTALSSNYNIPFIYLIDKLIGQWKWNDRDIVSAKK